MPLIPNDDEMAPVGVAVLIIALVVVATTVLVHFAR